MNLLLFHVHRHCPTSKNYHLQHVCPHCYFTSHAPVWCKIFLYFLVENVHGHTETIVEPHYRHVVHLFVSNHIRHLTAKNESLVRDEFLHIDKLIVAEASLTLDGNNLQPQKKSHVIPRNSIILKYSMILLVFINEHDKEFVKKSIMGN